MQDNPAEIRELAAKNGLDGDPLNGRSFPSIEEPLAQLGRDLFFSKALSGSTDTACVSCHHPVLGAGDALPLSIGVQAELPDVLGPGRVHSAALAALADMDYDGGPPVPRNAPTTFNIALWERFLFHDGRVERLPEGGIRTPDSAFGVADPEASDLVSAQARFPITSPEEMRADFEAEAPNDLLREALVHRIVAQELPNTWEQAFQEAYDRPDPASVLITPHTIAEAIAAYEASQIFVDSPWSRFMAGDDDAISAEARRGAGLFFRPVARGGAHCVACHSGDFFTDEKFHVVAFPQVGRGKGDGAYGDNDFGRERETGDPEDRYAFRTPSLLNVAETGPYGHAGSYLTLEGVVRHHLDPEAAIERYDFGLTELRQLQPGLQGDHALENTEAALAQLQTLSTRGKSRLEIAEMADADVSALVAFLESLTDPCVRDRVCLDPWIPDTGSSGHDALQLNARDKFGDLL